jgi:hypothetical protein
VPLRGQQRVERSGVIAIGIRRHAAKVENRLPRWFRVRWVSRNCVGQ